MLYLVSANYTSKEFSCLRCIVIIIIIIVTIFYGNYSTNVHGTHIYRVAQNKPDSLSFQVFFGHDIIDRKRLSLVVTTGGGHIEQCEHCFD